MCGIAGFIDGSAVRSSDMDSIAGSMTGRQLVSNEFSSARVGQERVALYARLLDSQPRPGSA